MFIKTLIEASLLCFFEAGIRRAMLDWGLSVLLLLPKKMRAPRWEAHSLIKKFWTADLQREDFSGRHLSVPNEYMPCPA